MKNYKIGDIIKCMVTNIESYGFFVSTDLWYSGLVHISEITEGYVKDVNNYVSVGDVIYCQILEVDEDSTQLKLSIKNINYKSSKKSKVVTKNSGCMTLKKNLQGWIDYKLEEIESKN